MSRQHRVPRLPALAAVLLWASLAQAGGFTVKGYVGNGPTTPVPDQQVLLVDGQGELVDEDVTGWTGAFRFEDVEPGDYYLLSGDHQIPIRVSGRNVRQDVDLASADGRLSYTQNAAEEFIRLLQSQAAQGAGGGGGSSGSGGGDMMPSMEGNPEGTTDCWGAAGCEGYDSGSGTYEMSE